VDLFFYRQTDQKQLLTVVENPDNSLNHFGKRQVELAMQLLNLARPRIILVANAFAARVFKKHFGLTKVSVTPAAS